MTAHIYISVILLLNIFYTPIYIYIYINIIAGVIDCSYVNLLCCPSHQVIAVLIDNFIKSVSAETQVLMMMVLYIYILWIEGIDIHQNLIMMVLIMMVPYIYD